jgi:hypothetical protein
MLTFQRVSDVTYQAADGSGWWLHVPATTSPEPTALDCTLIGHICLVTGKTKPVPCRELTLLKAYACGIREPESRQRWTSNVRYIVYEWQGDFSRPSIVIVKDCGGGPYYYVVDQLAFLETWKALAAVIDDATAWDVLSALTGTYDKGHEEGSKKLGTLFLQGRLKKRKRKGAYHLEILPS